MYSEASATPQYGNPSMPRGRDTCEIYLWDTFDDLRAILGRQIDVAAAQDGEFYGIKFMPRKLHVIFLNKGTYFKKPFVLTIFKVSSGLNR